MINTPLSIRDFRKEYRVFSNFYMKSVHYKGLAFPSNENAYQAAKINPDIRNSREQPWAWKREDFITLSPSQARSLGQKVELRPGWEDSHRYVTMMSLCEQKFRDGWEREALLKTGYAYLEEGNWWHDVFFGVCYGFHSNNPQPCAECLEKKGTSGENNLGKILMNIRERLALNQL